jgi:glycosyltransferase involved in cell wall biosynthesis
MPSLRRPHDTYESADDANIGKIGARTAIVQDWFQGFHGSERTVDAMRTGLFMPGNEPDIYTFHAARELLPRALAARIVRESRIARLPGIRQRGHNPGRWRLLLPLMRAYFRRLPLAEYELVISSSHAFAVDVRASDEAVHVCYCYTPMRYAWLPEVEAGRGRGVKAVALMAMRRRLQRADLRASRRPDAYAAISTAVRERIRAFYGRDAEVIHPPVDVERFDAHSKKEEGSFLWVNRLVAYKRPELIAEAFRGLPYRLTMVGVGPLEERLRRALPPNVELRGWVPRDELACLYARAAAFVHVAEEDFGITMVEALASGTPVVALDAGGARDIVRAGEDGILVPHSDLAALRDAVRQVAATQWDPGRLAERAQAFSRERFIGRLGRFVSEILSRCE